MTQAMIFSADETCDVGVDTHRRSRPTTARPGNAFNGTVNWVQIDVGRTITTI